MVCLTLLYNLINNYLGFYFISSNEFMKIIKLLTFFTALMYYSLFLMNIITNIHENSFIVYYSSTF